MEEYLFHISATIFLHVLTIKDLCFFEIGIICLPRLFYLLIRKQCRYIAFICLQHYMIKFASDFVTGWWLSLHTHVFSTNKTDRHDITDRLLKVALKTIN
jgi:hypothetical protein